MTLAMLVVLALLLSLGRWQLHRANEKQALFDAFEQNQDAPTAIDVNSGAVKRYARIEAKGRYDGAHQVLIDNMMNGERAGYYVITPFELQGGGTILVNRGWVPLGVSRAQLPPVEVSGEETMIHGRADHLPAAGIQLGKRVPLKPPYPVVAGFPTRAEIGALLNEPRFSEAGEALLLDAKDANGYVRNWAPPGFPPMRHIGYAVQWFGLAAALIVIYVVTNLKPVKA